MPRITEIHLIEVSPEKFLESCSPEELYEIHILMAGERYQQIIREFEDGHYCQEPPAYPELDELPTLNTID